MKENPLVDVQALKVTFGRMEALKGISFSIPPGKTLALVGESGSGKSTAALALMRLLQPTASTTGTIQLSLEGKENTDLLQLPISEMGSYRGKYLGMIFQEPMTALNPLLRVGQQVAEVLVQHEKISWKAAYARAKALFEEVQLPEPAMLLRRYPHQLSGGQRQRVMIAQAIACKPQLLVADEPTTALDPTVQRAILELVRGLQQKYNMALLFISHDLGVVRAVADEVAVLYKGEVVEQGPVEQVLSSPQHPYTKGLLACRPGGTPPGTPLPTVASFLQAEETKTEPTSTTESAIAPVTQEPPSITGQVVLEVEHLTVRYSPKDAPALDNISLQVYEGETLGIVGESGSGKSTLARVMLMLQTPTSGTLTWQNTDVATLNTKQQLAFRLAVQLVFQDPYESLNPYLTIGSQLMEPLAVHKLVKGAKVRQERVVEVLAEVGLDGSALQQYPHAFSGGQRQRICIARALLLEPKILVLDEAVAALDVSVQAQVLNLLNDLKAKHNLTYVCISHDLDVIRYFCDRVAVLKKGQLVQVGKTNEVFEKNPKDYTRTLLSAVYT